jgi:hypothetical protein
MDRIAHRMSVRSEVLLLFLEDDVLASFGVVLHELNALTAVDLVLGRHVLVTSTCGALELDDWALIASSWHQTLAPLRRMSARTFSIPCLLMVFRPLAETLSLTQRFSLGTQKRCVWMFTSQRRRVFRCE